MNKRPVLVGLNHRTIEQRRDRTEQGSKGYSWPETVTSLPENGHRCQGWPKTMENRGWGRLGICHKGEQWVLLHKQNAHK